MFFLEYIIAYIKLEKNTLILLGTRPKNSDRFLAPSERNRQISPLFSFTEYLHTQPNRRHIFCFLL